MQASLKALSALAAVAAIGALPAQAVQRTFVASYGNDANTATTCGFANPCRGFTAAHGVTDPNGEIIALDAAGYGAITITKSITITANPGFYAGISASTGSAVTIATAGVKVTLRGLNINGIGAADGVNMSNGARLSIENCVISNFTFSGVNVSTAASVRIVDSLIRDNNDGVYVAEGPSVAIFNSKILGAANAGIYVLGVVASTTTTVAVSDSLLSGSNVAINAFGYVSSAIVRVSVTRSTLSNNSYGMVVDSGLAAGVIGNSMVTGNGIALSQSGTAVLKSLGNNILDQNDANSSGTITGVGGG
jgi:hypothetical protein